MTLFEKLQKVRAVMAKAPLKMTGKNRGTGFEYFELGDFLPTLNVAMNEHKITAIPTFTKDVATLTVIDCEKPEDRYSITSPMGSAELRGCHEVQNIGAVETYQRRYLYMAMFDISDRDALDATINTKNDGKGDKKPAADKQPAKPAKPPVKAVNAATPNEDVPPDVADDAAPDGADVPFPPEEYKCSICGEVIEKSLFDGSIKKYGAPLCSKKCLEIMRKAEQARG